MEKLVFDSAVRGPLSKGEMKKMRASGQIPAVLYGDKENIQLLLDLKKFKALLHKAGRNAIINMNISDGSSRKSKTVLLKEFQRDPVSREIIHVDLFQLSMGKKIEVSIPIVLSGEAPGIKEGGVLTHIIRELKVKCLPTAIPDKISVDISNLQMGGAIAVKDLAISDDIEILMQSNQIVANVVKPTILEEVVPGVPAEAAAEPEVIGKGKKEEEGEEGVEAKPAEGKKEAVAAPVKEEKKPEKK